jgi:DNA repair ATPase RecN
MARIHVVKSAQKDQGNCVGCGKPIKKGMPYRWVKASRYANKFKRHDRPECLPFQQTEMEGNEKKAMCYQAQADLQNAIAGLGTWPKDDKRSDSEKAKELLDDLRTVFDEAAGQVGEAVDAWEESFDNLPEGFQQGDTGQQIEELKELAEAYKERLEEFPNEVDEWDEEEDYDLDAYVESIKEEADQAAGELEF